MAFYSAISVGSSFRSRKSTMLDTVDPRLTGSVKAAIPLCTIRG